MGEREAEMEVKEPPFEWPSFVAVGGVVVVLSPDNLVMCKLLLDD
jgi:hypothetical protein